MRMGVQKRPTGGVSSTKRNRPNGDQNGGWGTSARGEIKQSRKHEIVCDLTAPLLLLNSSAHRPKIMPGSTGVARDMRYGETAGG